MVWTNIFMTLIPVFYVLGSFYHWQELPRRYIELGIINNKNIFDMFYSLLIGFTELNIRIILMILFVFAQIPLILNIFRGRLAS